MFIDWIVPQILLVIVRPRRGGRRGCEVSRNYKRDSMRPTVIIILAVLIGALLVFDAYEYDGHYREAIWGQTKHHAGEIEQTVENWLGSTNHR